MPTQTSDRSQVAVIAYDGLCTFEFGIAIEIFGLPRPEFEGDWYRFAVAAVDRSPLRATGGIQIHADGGLELLANAGTIVVPGWKGVEVPAAPRLLNALSDAARRGARILSICSGAFLLAQASLLDGKRATTHWRYVHLLAHRYPNVAVDPDVLYTESGNILTSAGSAAGIDLCLHVVRSDYGADRANQVARRLVLPPHREGGQAQYVERPMASDPDNASLGPLFDWMRRHLHHAMPIAELARRAGMSRRTFLRRFKEASGQNPGEWLISERLRLARELLESSSWDVERIAQQSGFGSAATLRHHFRERLATTPTGYRSRFAR